MVNPLYTEARRIYAEQGLDFDAVVERCLLDPGCYVLSGPHYLLLGCAHTRADPEDPRSATVPPYWFIVYASVRPPLRVSDLFSLAPYELDRAGFSRIIRGRREFRIYPLDRLRRMLKNCPPPFEPDASETDNPR